MLNKTLSLSKLIFIVIFLSVCMYNVSADTIIYDKDNWNLTSGTMFEHGDTYLRASPNLTTGLVAYWNPGTDKGTGDILKDVYGVNDGVIYGATWDILNDSLYYDGVNDQTIIETHPSLNFTDSFFVEMFITPEDIGTQWQAVLLKGATNLPIRDFSVYLNYDEIYISWYYDGGYRSFYTTDANLQAKKHHIIYRRNITHEMIFVDKIKVIEAVIVYPFIHNNYDLRFGWKGNVESAEIFKGDIGITKFYSGNELTQNDINNSYNNYHNKTSYIQTNNIDAGFNQVHKNIQINGIDISSNTSMKVLINTSDDNITYNGWKVLQNNYIMNNTLIIPLIDEYRYIQIKTYSNTTFQPETNIIHNIRITTIIDNEGLAGYWSLILSLTNNIKLFIGLAFVTVIVLILAALGLFILKMIGIQKY